MKKRITPVIVIKTVVNLAALALFIFLFLNQKLPLWIAVFLIGTAASFLIGRWYCGWLCPMHIVFRPIDWLFEKVGIKRFRPPRFLTRPVVRFVILAIFIMVMIAQKIMGIQMPRLLYITGIAFLITLFFEERLWHASLCPYGTVLSLSGRTAPFSMKIDEEKCIGCGNCQTVCPTNAVRQDERKLPEGADMEREAEGSELSETDREIGQTDKKAKRHKQRASYTIDKEKCLTCFACARVCPTEAIAYRR